MPYDNSGQFTPVPGAITAQPGEVIRSTTWDSINSDYTTAFTTLGQQILQQPRIISVNGTIVATVNDSIILIQASVPSIALPASSTRSFPLRIVGGQSGVFSTFPCQLTPNGVETISGLVNITLTVDYQVVTLYPLASGGYVID